MNYKSTLIRLVGNLIEFSIGVFIAYTLNFAVLILTTYLNPTFSIHMAVVGIIQIIYIIPFMMKLKQARKYTIMKGLLTGAVTTALLCSVLAVSPKIINLLEDLSKLAENIGRLY